MSRSKIVFGAALVVAMLPSTALAQPTPQARAHAETLFREGVKLANEKAFDQACPKLEESQRLDPQPGTLLYVATCHEQQGKTATAWIEYNRAATLAARAGQQDRVDLARKRAQALEASLSYVVVSLEKATDGIAITLDGEKLEAPSFGTRLPVDPGEHAIEANAPNHRVWSTRFSVKTGDADAKINVPKLVANPTTETPAEPVKHEPDAAPVPEDHGSSTMRTLGFVGLGVGAVGLAAGTYFGLRARSLWNETDHYCNDKYCEDTGLEKTDDAKRAALISTISFGVGIAATGAGVYFLLASQPKAREPSGFVLASRPTAGGAMLSLRRTW